MRTHVLNPHRWGGGGGGGPDSNCRLTCICGEESFSSFVVLNKIVVCSCTARPNIARRVFECLSANSWHPAVTCIFCFEVGVSNHTDGASCQC